MGLFDFFKRKKRADSIEDNNNNNNNTESKNKTEEKDVQNSTTLKQFQPISNKNPNIKWIVENNTLTICGNGFLPQYKYDKKKPWESFYESIFEVVIEKGIISSGEYTFTSIPNLKKIVFGESCILIEHCVDKMPQSVEIKAQNVLFDCDEFVNYDSKEYPKETTDYIREKMLETYNFVIHNFFNDYPTLINRYLDAAQKDVYGWDEFAYLIYRELKQKVYNDQPYSPNLYWNPNSLAIFLDKCVQNKYFYTTMVDNDLCVYYPGITEESSEHMHMEELLALNVLFAQKDLLGKNINIRSNLRYWEGMYGSFFLNILGCQNIQSDYSIPYGNNEINNGNNEINKGKRTHPTIILYDDRCLKVRLEYIGREYKLYIEGIVDRSGGSCHDRISHLYKGNRLYKKDLAEYLSTRWRIHLDINFPNDEYISK